MGLADSRARTSVRYRFGPFELNPGTAELRRRGIRVPLSGQPLQILGILIENSTRLVTRDELREALWPGDVFVDFDGALNTAIKRLRQALDDPAAKEQYIETIPRQGYRFVAPVEVVMPPPAAPPTLVAPVVVPVAVPPVVPPPVTVPVSTPPEVPLRRVGWRWLAVTAAVIVAAVAIGMLGWFRRAEPLTLEHRAFLTSFPGQQTAPAISPAGGQVAFSRIDPAQDRVYSIYVTSIDGLGLHRLTHSPSGDFGPVWSPDGSQLAFVRRGPGSSDELMLVPAAGGPERRIAVTDGRYTAWSPDGREVIAAVQRPNQRNFDLWAVSIATAERREISSPGDRVDGWERFGYSPDGSLFGYAAWTSDEGPADLFVRPSRGGNPRRVTRLGSDLRGWCWLPDSRSVMVVSAEPGARRLFRIRLDNRSGTPELLQGAGDDIFNPAAVRAGGEVRIVFSQQRQTANLYQFTIHRDAHGAPQKLEAPRVAAPSTRSTTNPQISPDGRRLVFVSNRSLYDEIWLSDADGANARPLTAFASAGMTPGSPRWSPDGTKIVFAVAQNNLHDLYLAGVDGGGQVRLTHHSFDVIRPSWSVDGQWIYFPRRDTPVSPLKLWKIPARANVTEKDAVPLAVEAAEALESPEGGTLFYVPNLVSRALWSVPLSGGPPKVVIDSGIVRGWWTPVPGGIYYVDLTKTGGPGELEHPPVLYFDLHTNSSTVIGQLEHPPEVHQPGLTVWGDSLWTGWVDMVAINLVRGVLGR